MYLVGWFLISRFTTPHTLFNLLLIPLSLSGNPISSSSSPAATGDCVVVVVMEEQEEEQQQQQQKTEKESIKNASEEVSQQFKTLINNHHLDSINQSQQLILGRLQDSNAILSHFNDYSERCFAEVSGDFTRNTRLLRSMKTDLDYIFQKLRSMKGKILATYPDAFPDGSTMKILDHRPDLERSQ